MYLKDNKDFILGYKITVDGKIIIDFSPKKCFWFIKKKSKPWPIPYSEGNEQIVLDKMKKQLDKFDDIECKLEKKKNNYFTWFLGFFLVGLFSSTFALSSEMVSEIIMVSSGSVCISMIPLIISLKINSKLNDLRKNVKFLEIEEKLNDSIRTNQNTLVDVSNKTKNIIKDFPKDRPVFDINSFNYVPFKDLEQIMENVDRNERFGFDYTKQEEPAKGIVRKKIR